MKLSFSILANESTVIDLTTKLIRNAWVVDECSSRGAFGIIVGIDEDLFDATGIIVGIDEDLFDATGIIVGVDEDLFDDIGIIVGVDEDLFDDTGIIVGVDEDLFDDIGVSCGWSWLLNCCFVYRTESRVS